MKMKILENGIIKDKYDVIVIGAGNGGLTAAALLAKRGVDVLVIEQHYIPGGAVTALRRQDITCDIGAAILFGFTPESYNPHYYIMNELEEPIDMVWHESVFSMYWGDKKVTFWRDFNKFFKELAAAFPDKEKELKDYYDFMFKIYQGLLNSNVPMSPSEIPLSVGFKSFIKHPMSLLRLLPMLKKTGYEILERYQLVGGEVEKFFDVCMGLFTTTKMNETPQVIPNAMFADMHIGGACYPVGSPQMLPNKLERAIERYGGHIIQRLMVKQILFDQSGKKPKAIGVELDNGIIIKADHILSNADIYQTFGKLIKRELVDPKKYDYYQNMRPTTSCLILYMGVDKEAIPKDRQNIEFLIQDKDDFTTGNNLYVFIPSMDDYSIVPEDAHSLTIMYPKAAHEVQWPKPGDPFYQSEEYNKLKEKYAQEAIEQLNKYYDGIKDHIKFCEIATPSTLERFLMKYKGNVAGPAQIVGQDLMKRPHARLKDYKNLYYCGDSTTMGEGVVSTAASGVSAANAILKKGKFGKIYLPHKFKKNVINLLDKGPKKIALPSDEEDLNEKTAQRLAQQCQWCEKDQCRTNCPAGIDILNFIRRIESSNYLGAARLLREMNPLAEICGYICPSERLCEKECERYEFSERSTQIRRLQKWVCEKAGEEGFLKYIPDPNGKKVAIIGAGPAGISCAHFLARLGYKITIYEKKERPGGMLSYVIPDFRLPREIIQNEFNGIALSPINFQFGKELGRDVSIKELLERYDSIFLAPGLWKGRILDLPGLDKSQVIDALSLIRKYNEEGKVKIKDNVLIIGGGSVAADAAAVLKKLGIKKIKLICLESEEEMPMLEHELEELKEMGVELIHSWGPKEVSKGKLTCIQCKSVFDDFGAFCPEFDESILKEIEFNQIVMAIGQTVEDSLANYLKSEFGTIQIKVAPNTQLIEGKDKIYAGGDIIRGAGTVVQAVGDAKRAAMAIHLKLMGN